MSWRNATSGKADRRVLMFGPIGLAGLLGLAVWLPAVTVMGQVYQWRDSRGVIHFTDNWDVVPGAMRGSPDLIVRRDLVRGIPSGPSTEPARVAGGPLPERKAVQADRAPAPRPVGIGPTVIYKPQKITTIVVVNFTIIRTRGGPAPGRVDGRQSLRRDFEDRRFIHPSAFTGSPALDIHPEFFSK